MNSVAQIKVYFNNGASVTQPWHVAGTEGKSMADDYGQFKSAETAISKALEVARISKAKLIVPLWLQGMADEIAADDARYADLRENDSIGRDESGGNW